ncbi:MAG TPA: PEP-CTERM sorting domain-containing protein [Opitutus sp.]|nr:PEP-CTERM sorting domain-containing protein [Opitutus sp.]
MVFCSGVATGRKLEFSSTAADLGLMSGGAVPIRENRVYFDGTITRFETEILPVPEPATYAAFASAGPLAIVLARRRKAEEKPS